MNNFLADFASLEAALARGVDVPLERMIVELRLTPEKIAKLERREGVKLQWFPGVYRALRRHHLLLRDTPTWNAWLEEYRRRRNKIGRRPRIK